MVLEIRDLWPDIPIAVGALHNPAQVFAAQILEWVAYHQAKHLIALSPGIAEGIVRRGIPEDRVTVLPNSSDLDLFDVPASQGEEVRSRLGLMAAQPLVVYAGTFGLINGIGYLIDIADEMRSIAPDIRFLLVGEGREQRDIEEKAKQSGVLNNNLFIWKPVPKMEMPKILAAATIATSFVIPLKLLWHNSANKFFDALAASKPIAINYGGWQADVLKESGAGIVLPPDDPQAAAHALADFTHNPQRLQAAGRAARHLAETRFNRDDLAKELENILQRATQN